jgi:integrase
MGRRKKEPTIDLVTMSENEARDILAEGTVNENTLKSYEGMVKKIVNFLKGKKLTKGKFYQFLVFFGRLDHWQPSTAAKYRVALLHTQRKGRHCGPNGHCWAADADVKKLCLGIGRASKTPPGPQRGAVTAIMLQQAFAALAKAGTPVPALDKSYLRLTYEGALRRNELATMRTKKISCPDGKRFFVQLEVDKRSKAGTPYKGIHGRLVTKAFVTLYDAITLGKGPNDYVIPETPTTVMDRLNTYIQRAAVLCKWYPGLVFDGVHCLRHGHAVDFHNDAHLCERMNCLQENADAYSRSNEARLLGCRKRSRTD